MSDSVLKALKEWASDPENVKQFQETFRKNQERKERYINKLANLTIGQRSEFIQKCIDKYESNEYVNKEYKLGYEPRCPLYDVIFNYASRYGESLECNEDFLAERYKFDNWIVELYIGQGSFIRIYDRKINC